MVIFDYKQPRSELREFIREYQIIQFKFPQTFENLPIKPYWPRPEITLSFFPKDQEGIAYEKDSKPLKSYRSRFQGQHTQTTFRHVGKDMLVFQVLFQPGGFYRITGIPAQFLTNTYIDAEMVFFRETRELNERLSNSLTYQEMIPWIEGFLLNLIKKVKIEAHPIDKAARLLLEYPFLKNLDWLADQACLSQRQFYRVFTEREGVSPKTLARISRLDKVVKTKNRTPSMDWLSLAVDFNYFDYQHLSKDFRDFTGLSPIKFYELENKSPERSFGIIEP